MHLRALVLLFLFACGQPTATESPDGEPQDGTQITQPATDEANTPDAPVAADAPLSMSNWKSHPSLDEIRAMVKTINDGSMTADEKRFASPCGDEEALASKLVKDSEGRVRMLETTKGVDLWRMTRQFYDESGQLRFGMATYTHSSAESKMLSRRYLNADGTTLFEPDVEQVSEKSGPTDGEAMDAYLIAKATDAAAEHNGLVETCEVQAQACCCQHSDPAGAGLTRFSRDQGTCDGSIFMKGCVDSGICDVAKLEKSIDAKRLEFTLPSGKTVSIIGDPTRLYDHGEGAIVLYDSSPADKSAAMLAKNIQPPPTKRIDDSGDTESHGTVKRFEWESEGLSFDFEANCQGGTGTCIWLPATPTVKP